ncbi:MAG: hypothetical protein MUE71_12735 [Chitinophagaceae bacterium]|jgi:hypothetical protein|nr:hypothetical protein [Chitinophagaceae bacterium]
MDSPVFEGKLSPLQLELLKLGNIKLSDEEFQEVKAYFADLALRRLSKTATEAALEKGYTDKDYEAWLNDENQ